MGNAATKALRARCTTFAGRSPALPVILMRLQRYEQYFGSSKFFMENLRKVYVNRAGKPPCAVVTLDLDKVFTDNKKGVSRH